VFASTKFSKLNPEEQAEEKRKYNEKRKLPVEYVEGDVISGSGPTHEDVELQKRLIAVTDKMQKESGCHAITLVARFPGGCAAPYNYAHCNSGMNNISNIHLEELIMYISPRSGFGFQAIDRRPTWQ